MTERDYSWVLNKIKQGIPGAKNAGHHIYGSGEFENLFDIPNHRIDNLKLESLSSEEFFETLVNTQTALPKPEDEDDKRLVTLTADQTLNVDQKKVARKYLIRRRQLLKQNELKLIAKKMDANVDDISSDSYEEIFYEYLSSNENRLSKTVGLVNKESRVSQWVDESPQEALLTYIELGIDFVEQEDLILSALQDDFEWTNEEKNILKDKLTEIQTRSQRSFIHHLKSTEPTLLEENLSNFDKFKGRFVRNTHDTVDHLSRKLLTNDFNLNPFNRLLTHMKNEYDPNNILSKEVAIPFQLNLLDYYQRNKGIKSNPSYQGYDALERAINDNRSGITNYPEQQNPNNTKTRVTMPDAVRNIEAEEADPLMDLVKNLPTDPNFYDEHFPIGNKGAGKIVELHALLKHELADEQLESYVIRQMNPRQLSRYEKTGKIPVGLKSHPALVHFKAMMMDRISNFLENEAGDAKATVQIGSILIPNPTNPYQEQIPLIQLMQRPAGEYLSKDLLEYTKTLQAILKVYSVKHFLVSTRGVPFEEQSEKVFPKLREELEVLSSASSGEGNMFSQFGRISDISTFPKALHYDQILKRSFTLMTLMDDITKPYETRPSNFEGNLTFKDVEWLLLKSQGTKKISEEESTKRKKRLQAIIQKYYLEKNKTLSDDSVVIKNYFPEFNENYQEDVKIPLKKIAFLSSEVWNATDEAGNYIVDIDNAYSFEDLIDNLPSKARQYYSGAMFATDRADDLFYVMLRAHSMDRQINTLTGKPVLVAKAYEALVKLFQTGAHRTKAGVMSAPAGNPKLKDFFGYLSHTADRLLKFKNKKTGKTYSLYQAVIDPRIDRWQKMPIINVASPDWIDNMGHPLKLAQILYSEKFPFSIGTIVQNSKDSINVDSDVVKGMQSLFTTTRYWVDSLVAGDLSYTEIIGHRHGIGYVVKDGKKVLTGSIKDSVELIQMIENNPELMKTYGSLRSLILAMSVMKEVLRAYWSTEADGMKKGGMGILAEGNIPNEAQYQTLIRTYYSVFAKAEAFQTDNLRVKLRYDNSIPSHLRKLISPTETLRDILSSTKIPLAQERFERAIDHFKQSISNAEKLLR